MHGMMYVDVMMRMRIRTQSSSAPSPSALPPASSTIRASMSPPVILPAHVDKGYMTIIHSSSPGLEVKHKNDWHRVRLNDDECVVMISDAWNDVRRCNDAYAYSYSIIISTITISTPTSIIHHPCINESTCH